MEILQATPACAGEIARLNDAVQKMHAGHHPDAFNVNMWRQTQRD